ncbi:MAG: zinc ribbon domain-containing protein [Muribaculaceae bacterium]|nr:zinc ribbon domain-containing protein [Muribaculaceae bacterium]
MNYIECPECGNHLPLDSKFCNQCGTRIEATVSNQSCPHCGNMIPRGSTFCPQCGKQVNEPSRRVGQSHVITDEQPQQPQPQPQAAPARSQAQRTNVIPVPAGAQKQQARNDYEEDFEDSPLAGDNAKMSDNPHFTRNFIIGAVIVAFVGLVFVQKCFFSKPSRDRGAVNDSTAALVDANSQSADLFQKALDENNLLGDRSVVAYAMRFSGTNTGTNDKIVGISYLSNDTHPFYKIYEMTPNGDAWNIELTETRYLDGRSITFDRSRLKANEDALPMIAEIGGKRYLFFAYLSTPTNTSSQGRVVLNLYDIEQHKVTQTLSYEGAFTNRDGEQVIVSDPLSNGSAAQNYMEDQARTIIGLIHVKTQEELDEEKKAEEEKEKEEEEKPADANEEWKEDNAGKISEAMDGNVVQFEQNEHDKDKPMFKKDDIAKKIAGGNYTIFLTKDGKVFSFNKSNNKNTLLYAGGSKASDIGWHDSKNGILNIRTGNGQLRYNVTNGKAVLNKDAAPKKEEEPKKSE